MPAGRSPARGKAADNTLEQDRAESCRGEQATFARDARCPERDQRGRRRERDDRDGDDAMGIFDEGLPRQRRQPTPVTKRPVVATSGSGRVQASQAADGDQG